MYEVKRTRKCLVIKVLVPQETKTNFRILSFFNRIF